MKFIYFTTILTACIAAAVLAAPGAIGTRRLENEPTYLTQQKTASGLSRSRRWILTWLLGHSAVMDHARRQANESKAPSYNAVQGNTLQEVDSAERVHDLPETEPVDLSGDLRVNYQEGRGRTSALAQESDAEVFDWNLLQEDRNRNAAEPNPHYYQSNSGSLSQPTAYGVPSASYLARPARPAWGVLTSSGASGLNRFNRFPISFEQSQEYANSNSRSSAIRAIRA